MMQKELVDDLQLWISEREGKIPIEVLYLPRPSTSYKGCFPLHFEKHLERLLQDDSPIHLFSGSSKFGVTVDSNAECNPMYVCKAEKLPFESNSFKSGFADPPYDEKFAKELYNCEYPEWGKWTKELVRVVKPGGLIGIMQNYPVPRLAGCEWERLVIIILRIKQFCKIVTIQRKTVEKERLS